MANESGRYNRRAIRQLLLAAFNAEELQDLFYFSKTPELRAVPDQFAQGDSYPTKVRKAVRYCDSRFLLGEMLAEVKEANPRAYEKYDAMLRARPGTEPARTRARWLVPVLAAVLVVVVVGLGVVLLLLLREPAPPPEPTPTETAQATDTPSVTPTLASSPTSVPAPTYMPTATVPPEPTATPTPTRTSGPSPTPTLTLEPSLQRQFVVVYRGADGVNVRSGPGTSYPTRETVYAGALLVVDGAPETRGDLRWWPVHAERQRGWVVEWIGDTRLVKPLMEVDDTVVVANPMSTGNVNLWDDNCDNPLVLSRGTVLTVLRGPDPKCDEPGALITLEGREWWYVETPEGLRGWIADFSSQNWGDWVKAVLVAPQWYVELTTP
jgi:uncharacterized protein YraI